jgi:hypothetical protein
MAQYGLPSTWAFWRGQDYAFLERCDELVVLMLDGWGESVGVQGEIGIAQELGKPIRFLSPADLQSSEADPLRGTEAPERSQHSAADKRFLPGRN